MATTTANVDTDNITVHQDNDDSNHDGDTTGQATAAAGSSGTGNATTNFHLRVEQNKIPSSLGRKARLLFLPWNLSGDWNIWPKQINGQTHKPTYYHFANSIRNQARKWLSSMVDMENEEPEQHLWTEFKDVFKKEYTVQANERLILEGLSNLAMKPKGSTNEIISCITYTIRVIKESYEDYDTKIPTP
jgi:hypothetical protein